MEYERSLRKEFIEFSKEDFDYEHRPREKREGGNTKEGSKGKKEEGREGEGREREVRIVILEKGIYVNKLDLIRKSRNMLALIILSLWKPSRDLRLERIVL